MKRSIFFTLLVFVTALSACNKKDTPISKVSFLTTGSWSLAGAAHDNDGNGSYETDDFAAFPACYRDNIWTFRTNGDLEFNEGNSKCDPIDPQTDITKWQLINNESTLVLDGDNYSITELSNTNLKLKEVLGGNRSSIVTFAKR